MTTLTIDELFDRRLDFPDIESKVKYNKLVGIDVPKNRLEKLLGLLINPTSLVEWQNKYHPMADVLINRVMRRPPLIILAGDVGTGKTELGETVGDAVARRFDVPITLFPMSLSTRGSGRVGEMTQLISVAFDQVYDEAYKLKREKNAVGGIILLIDEADALVQSRENSQMHHEDRAGVNAFIRGIDRLAESGVPAAIIMCTNRLLALDPAIQRRACEIFSFNRPNEDERFQLLFDSLDGIGLMDNDIRKLAQITGENQDRDYGFTYSDITQRLLPAIVLNAFPDKGITYNSAFQVAQTIKPTPPFREVANG